VSAGVGRWTEVVDEVFRRRYQPWDVSVCVVRGGAGLLVVDTRSSHRQADELRADLRELGPLPVVAVVNTHAHFDHTFGNARFGPGSDLDAPIYAHRLVPAHLDAYERPMLADLVSRGEEPVDEWREVVITPPTVLVDDGASLSVGDRTIAMRHLGRGHTDNDLLVHVRDAGAWLVGDVLEESGPPMYGSGSCPLDWPATVGRLCDAVEPGEVLVPGHGESVDSAFAAKQQAQLQAVADLIRELHAAQVPEAEAVAAGGHRWPFPADGMQAAVRDGYRQLEARTT
jgi:glyoxylase-like metal-dependent hydrolase (beta-lactamase superfamily II)